MSRYICSKCKSVYTEGLNGICPNCGAPISEVYDFKNSDDYLRREIPIILKERKETGLEGLVSGLDCIIINTEPQFHDSAVREILNYTGMKLYNSYRNSLNETDILKTDNSANILVRSRLTYDNPFQSYNLAPKARYLPNTRLETFVFEVKNLEKYVEIQKSRGINFLTKEIQYYDNHSYIQTIPSHYIGCSIGFVEWHQNKGDYVSIADDIIEKNIVKPDNSYLKNIKYLDHTATRVRARDRDAAIIEFMELTNYNFDFAIYVKNLNSITSVARLSTEDFAMVFTSGITPFIGSESSGPTERYTSNYGTRVHHMAFHTENIDDTFMELKKDGMEFLIELVGSPDEGLKQTFSVQSPNTLIVNEYIQRFRGFDGFFTKSNVTELTRSTEKQ